MHFGEECACAPALGGPRATGWEFGHRWKAWQFTYDDAARFNGVFTRHRADTSREHGRKNSGPQFASRVNVTHHESATIQREVEAIVAAPITRSPT